MSLIIVAESEEVARRTVFIAFFCVDFFVWIFLQRFLGECDRSKVERPACVENVVVVSGVRRERSRGVRPSILDTYCLARSLISKKCGYWVEKVFRPLECTPLTFDV